MCGSPCRRRLASSINTNIEEAAMRKAIMFGTMLVAVVLAGSVSAGSAKAAAVVVNDAGCVTNFFGTTCTVIKTTTNATTTPSGNVSYVTNGTVERRIEFSFGGSYTSNSTIHVHTLAKQGEIRTSSEHYDELIDYVSGTWFMSCVSGFDIHWTNGEAQFIRSELSCETP
jgi:hypothetical protein